MDSIAKTRDAGCKPYMAVGFCHMSRIYLIRIKSKIFQSAQLLTGIPELIKSKIIRTAFYSILFIYCVMMHLSYNKQPTSGKSDVKTH